MSELVLHILDVLCESILASELFAVHKVVQLLVVLQLLVDQRLFAQIYACPEQVPLVAVRLHEVLGSQDLFEYFGIRVYKFEGCLFCLP